MGSRSTAAFVVLPCAYRPHLGGSSFPTSFTIDFFIGFALPQRLLAVWPAPRRRVRGINLQLPFSILRPSGRRQHSPYDDLSSLCHLEKRPCCVRHGKLHPRSLAHAWGSDGFATVIGFALPHRHLVAWPAPHRCVCGIILQRLFSILRPTLHFFAGGRRQHPPYDSSSTCHLGK